jgi:hypothetical protein
MRVRGQRGQTTSEYLMIAGLITAMALLVLGWTYSPFRASLQAAAECVLGDVCGTGTPSGGGGASMPRLPGGGAPGGSPGGGPLPWVDPTIRLCLKRPLPTDCSPTRADAEEAACIAYGLWHFRDDYQNCKAIRKRQECACGNCDECDGSVTFPGNGIVCVHNDTDPSSLLGKDLDESGEMIHDVTRMIDNKDPLITENDSIKQMKSQIVKALRETGVAEPIELIGFSQGSAVLASALWQLRRDGGIPSSDWSRLHVVVMGAAEQRFPPELSTIDSYTSKDDHVAWGGEKQWELNSGDVATPLPISVGEDNMLGLDVEPCTLTGAPAFVAGKCHDSIRYLKFHAARMKKMHSSRDPLPARTIIVNGIGTEFEGWNAPRLDENGQWIQGGCQAYADARFGKIGS